LLGSIITSDRAPEHEAAASHASLTKIRPHRQMSDKLACQEPLAVEPCLTIDVGLPQPSAPAVWDETQAIGTWARSHCLYRPRTAVIARGRSAGCVSARGLQLAEKPSVQMVRHSFETIIDDALAVLSRHRRIAVSHDEIECDLVLRF
jgi:hypothetical protein